jgi:outer membrane protein
MKSLLLIALLAGPVGAEPALTAPAGDTVLNMRLQAMLKRRPLEGTEVALDYAAAARAAVRQNLGLQVRRWEVQAAQARYRQARAQRLPTLNSYASYRQKAPDIVEGLLPDTRFIKEAQRAGFKASDLYVTGQNQMFNRATLYIPVYTGGQLEAQMHVQAALAEVEKYGLERARELIAFQAKHSVLDVLLAQENVRVAEQSLAQAKETVRFARERLAAGVANKYDLLQSEVALDDARDSITTTRTSLEKARTVLASLLNLPILTPFRLRDTLSELAQVKKTESQDPEELTQLALAQRPELDQMKQRLVAVHERGNAAAAGLLPKLLIHLNYDFLGSTLALRGGISALGSLLIPILDGGLTHARKQELDLLAQQLGTDELRVAQSVTLEVLRALFDTLESDARLKAAKTAEASAREAVRIASLRFQIGAGTSLELVTAQTALSNAGYNLAEAYYRQILAQEALELALGQRVGESE